MKILKMHKKVKYCEVKKENIFYSANSINNSSKLPKSSQNMQK
jgi:hypothetical protein